MQYRADEMHDFRCCDRGTRVISEIVSSLSTLHSLLFSSVLDLVAWLPLQRSAMNMNARTISLSITIPCNGNNGIYEQWDTVISHGRWQLGWTGCTSSRTFLEYGRCRLVPQ